LTHYVVRFSDGRVLERKNSKRIYTHGWRVTATFKDGTPTADEGFARSLELAMKAANSVANRWQRTDCLSGRLAELYPATNIVFYTQPVTVSA
jgi:hypothetical protein